MKASTLSAVSLVTRLEQGLVLMLTTNTTAIAAILESGLVQQGILMTATRVAMQQLHPQIMATKTSNLWDISWYNEKELMKSDTASYLDHFCA